MTLAVAGVATVCWLAWPYRNPPARTTMVSPAQPPAGLATRPLPTTARMVPITRLEPVVSAAPENRKAALVLVDGSASHETRIRAIESLRMPLAESDWKVIRNFLLKPDGLDRTQLGQVRKNELMDALCALSPPPADLGAVLATIYRNSQQHEVTRDYAVQHLAAYYEQVSQQLKSGALLQTVQDFLWEATGETGTSIGGILAAMAASWFQPSAELNIV